jgi:hypothetical protein
MKNENARLPRVTTSASHVRNSEAIILSSCHVAHKQHTFISYRRFHQLEHQGNRGARPGQVRLFGLGRVGGWGHLGGQGSVIVPVRLLVMMVEFSW